MQLPRPDHEVHPRGAFPNQCLILLGHAAQHAHHEPGPFLLLHSDPTQRRINFILGMLPHAARVIENGVGIGRGLGHLPARSAQRRHNQLAVEHVHLASDCFDPQLLGHGFDSNDHHDTLSTCDGVWLHVLRTFSMGFIPLSHCSESSLAEGCDPAETPPPTCCGDLLAPADESLATCPLHTPRQFHRRLLPVRCRA